MRKVLLLFLFSLLLCAQEDGYTLGNGLRLGTTPIYIGSYFSVEYKAQENKTRQYAVDDFALLSYAEYHQFAYMAEIEYKNPYVKTTTPNDTFVKRDKQLHIERLYLDYTYDENILVRFGKYNTPVGFWNLLPINVLRATTSNPYTNELLFPEFTTGINFVYTSYNDAELQVDVMVQHNNDLDDDYNNYEMDEHYGIGVSCTVDALSVKLNGGYFHQIERQKRFSNRYYLMVSARYATPKIELMSEVGYQTTSKEATTPFAGYAQALYRINRHHEAIVRAEHFKDNIVDKQDSIMLLGYTYRPLYPVAIKGEYQFHSQSQSDQVIFSFSVLF